MNKNTNRHSKGTQIAGQKTGGQFKAHERVDAAFNPPTMGDTSVERAIPEPGEHGETVWRLPDGTFHRDHGPAVEHPDGTNEWWHHGYLHREDGPAIEYADGTTVWHRYGENHRTDGPAIHDPNTGAEEWWNDGQLHRENGPSVTYADGSKEWYQYGELHRDDGPAIASADGTQEYWVNGKQLTAQQFEQQRKTVQPADPDTPLDLRTVWGGQPASETGVTTDDIVPVNEHSKISFERDPDEPEYVNVNLTIIDDNGDECYITGTGGIGILEQQSVRELHAELITRYENGYDCGEEHTIAGTPVTAETVGQLFKPDHHTHS